MKFLKLVNFELNRFSKFYYLLVVAIILIQLSLAAYIVNDYMRMLKASLKSGQTMPDFLDSNGNISILNVTETNLFMVSVMLGVLVLGIYLFFIWYRDWFGKHTFIYRLLTLPASRMNMYFAKAAAILLMIFGLLAVQVFLLHIIALMIETWVPGNYRSEFNFYHLMEASQLNIVLPHSFIGFLCSYGAGLVVLFTLFTSILLERSYRLRGVILGGIYAAVAIFVFTIPLWYTGLSEEGVLLYPDEERLAMFATGLVVVIGSILLSRYLLKHKITV